LEGAIRNTNWRTVIMNTNKYRKNPDTPLTTKLSMENSISLSFLAKVLNMEPEQILNRFILRDMFSTAMDQRSGYLRDVVEHGGMVFPTVEAKTAVMRKIKDFEKNGLEHFAPLTCSATA
jgi:hypothetical protein